MPLMTLGRLSSELARRQTRQGKSDYQNENLFLNPIIVIAQFKKRCINPQFFLSYMPFAMPFAVLAYILKYKLA